jgi:hypothetical protein
LSNQLLRVFADKVAIAGGMPFVDAHVAADRPAQLPQPLHECGSEDRHFRIICA